VPSESDDARFEREALRWFDDVYRFAYSLTRNQSDADDLVQDTYLRAYRSWRTFSPGSNALCWLFTICRHRHIRQALQSRRTVDLEHADVASTVNVHEQTAQRELVALIHDAIRRLPEPYRSTIVLVDIEDRTYASAATVCRVPVGTIRSRVHRARRLIRGMMPHHTIV
jgi:RNA polymerase sigma-70 factor, ECF subfamily